MIPHSRPDIGDEETRAVRRVLAGGMLAQGREVESFEEECAAFCGRRHGVAVSSGTAALHLALGAVGVGPWEGMSADERSWSQANAEEPMVRPGSSASTVIPREGGESSQWTRAPHVRAGQGPVVAMPSYACAALITAARLQQAVPCLCDIDKDFNLDPAEVPSDVRVVIVPHLFGAPAALPDNEVVIEDIAQSIGGDTGRRGLVTVASFYATKLMTTGEGGMLLTDDEAVADYARDRRDYDNRDDFVMRYPYKMTDFQAALGRVQLRRLPAFISRRREMARRYSEAFSGLPVRLPGADGHVYFRYVIALDRRDELREHLHARGVEAKPPVYRPAHHYLGGAFPNAEAAHRRCLSLPLYPAMHEEETARVISSVLEFAW